MRIKYRTVILAFIAVAFCIAWLEAQKPSAQPAYEVVSALISEKPRELKQLEKIVGALNRNTADFAEALGPIERQNLSTNFERVRVELSIDIYHQDPRETQNPSLAAYELWFLSGRAASFKLLEKQFGTPIAIQRCGCLRFGEFYFTEVQNSEKFSFAWYQKEPKFAISDRTPSQTQDLVVHVSAILKEGFSPKTIEKHLGKLSPDADWNEDVIVGDTWKVRIKASENDELKQIRFEFKRPIPAEAILKALNVEDPVVVSTDEHVTSRIIFDFKRKQFPTAHGFQVRIHVIDSNLNLTKEHLSISPVWRSPAYQIASIEVLPI